MSFFDFLPVIGQAVGGLFGNYQQNKANKANMELARYQNEANLNLWNLQNEYNTPANQVSRYLEAGLNPALMYSQGNSGNAVAPTPTQVPEIRKFQNFGDLGASAALQLHYNRDMQLKQYALDEEVKQATAFKLRAEGVNALSRQSGIVADSMSKQLQRDFLKQSYDQRLGIVQESLDRAVLNNNRLRIESAYLPDFQKAELLKANESIRNLIQQRNLSITQVGNLLLSRGVMRATIGKIQAETKKSEAECKRIYADVLKTFQEMFINKRKFNNNPYDGIIGKAVNWLPTTFNILYDNLDVSEVGYGVNQDLFEQEFNDFEDAINKLGGY